MTIAIVVISTHIYPQFLNITVTTAAIVTAIKNTQAKMNCRSVELWIWKPQGVPISYIGVMWMSDSWWK